MKGEISFQPIFFFRVVICIFICGCNIQSILEERRSTFTEQKVTGSQELGSLTGCKVAQFFKC